MDDIKNEIIEMVDRVDNIWLLNQILRCIINITK